MAILASMAASGSITAESSPPVGEEDFRRLYEQTARPLKAYLRRVLLDTANADDVLQDCYLRFILAKLPSTMTPQHQKNYLFRIATNLCHDHHRRKPTSPLAEGSASVNPTELAGQQRDIQRFLAKLEPAQRQLLWLAYVERFSHHEIADVLGAKPASIRSMLFRARARLSEIMKQGGFKPQENRS